MQVRFTFRRVHLISMPLTPTHEVFSAVPHSHDPLVGALDFIRMLLVLTRAVSVCICVNFAIHIPLIAAHPRTCTSSLCTGVWII